MRRLGHCIVGIALAAALGPVWTSHGGRAQAETRQDGCRFENVDQIIDGKRFVRVDRYSYEKAIETGLVVVFHYDNRQPCGFDGGLAHVLAAMLDKFPDIKFVAYPAFEDGLPGSELFGRFGFTGTPYFALFREGKRLYGVGKGPAPQSVARWTATMEDIIRKKFYRDAGQG